MLAEAATEAGPRMDWKRGDSTLKQRLGMRKLLRGFRQRMNIENALQFVRALSNSLSIVDKEEHQIPIFACHYLLLHIRAAIGTNAYLVTPIRNQYVMSFLTLDTLERQ